MTLRRFILASLIALVAACGAGKPQPTAPSNGMRPEVTAPKPSEPATVVGRWREFWGVEGQTDVVYHDEYEVGYDGDVPFVLPLNQEHPDKISRVTMNDNALDLVIETAFEVHYQLRLDPGGASMSGTATTPDKQVPIRWQRITD